MAFPETRLTLIRRLSLGGSDVDWREFLDDYWSPVCGFAMRWGGLKLHDAEDIASETFQILLSSQLLTRWHDNRKARLRTLLCSVARNVISNRARTEQGRRRILQELAQQPIESLPESIWSREEPTAEQSDAFYAAWVQDLLARCVERVMRELHREGKGDYFRVLYGRVCEELPVNELAELLQIKPTSVENYFKAAKKRLTEALEKAVQQHVGRYCEAEDIEQQFRAEWVQLSNYLEQHGGLERAVFRCQQSQAEGSQPTRRSKAFQLTRNAVGKIAAGAPPSGD